MQAFGSSLAPAAPATSAAPWPRAGSAPEAAEPGAGGFADVLQRMMGPDAADGAQASQASPSPQTSQASKAAQAQDRERESATPAKPDAKKTASSDGVQSTKAADAAQRPEPHRTSTRKSGHGDKADPAGASPASSDMPGLSGLSVNAAKTDAAHEEQPLDSGDTLALIGAGAPEAVAQAEVKSAENLGSRLAATDSTEKDDGRQPVEAHSIAATTDAVGPDQSGTGTALPADNSRTGSRLAEDLTARGETAPGQALATADKTQAEEGLTTATSATAWTEAVQSAQKQAQAEVIRAASDSQFPLVGAASALSGGVSGPAGSTFPGGPAAAQTLETQIQASVQQPGFAPALGMRIATLVKDGIEKASIRLNPAEMGPVAVKLALEGTQVRVEMSAELAATRQVLEQSLPSLAGALREAGFTLSGGGVFQQHPDRPQGDGDPTNNPSGRGASSSLDDATEGIPASRPAVRTSGLVDIFA